MQFKFLQSICEFSDNRKIVSASWSPNYRKLAVATSDRQILLFDDQGERRDKFTTKPANAELGRRSYVIKAIAFSPDSTKLAVAQSDCYVFVYKLGDDWATKKAICNKFAQSTPVLCMVWLQTGPIVCGMMDGKVRMLQIKSNASHSLYGIDSAVISLCSNSDGSGFLSGHIDGSIIRCYVVDRIEENNATSCKIVTHSVPPFALGWAQQGDVIAAGCDRRVLVYNRNGKLIKQFDYNRHVNANISRMEFEFSVACVSPSGQAVLVGGYNKLHVYTWNTKQGIWEESRNVSSGGSDGNNSDLDNMYTIQCLTWRLDGAKIACGTLNGNVLLFESVLKRSIWKDKLEITYVGPSQILIKPLKYKTEDLNINENVLLRTHSGQEIEDVKIMGRDGYCLARTKTTLLLADLFHNTVSEVAWYNTTRSEKFYFENAGVCLIFNSGELSLIEYGNNHILSCVRTEFANPHLISVRLNDRVALQHSQQKVPDNKMLAYLIDLKTICIVDLLNGKTISQVNHESKIDWLELNETCRKLLFRDIKQRLLVVDIHTDVKACIFSGVSFVQWVPNSDVCIAQSGTTLAVWYNIDLPERPTITTIKGEVYDVIRANGTTDIVTLDNNTFKLDEGLLEFGTAIHDHDYGKAILFLEMIENDAAEAEAMWYNLLSIAQTEQNVQLIVRCSAAVGKNATVFCAQDLLKVSLEYDERSNTRATQEVMLKMDILNGNLELAKSFYLERQDVDKIIALYRKLHRLDEAITLSQKMYSNAEQSVALKAEHMRNLLVSGQYERAAIILESDGENKQALTMYLKANRLLKVSSLLSRDANLMGDSTLVNNVLKRLIKIEHYEAAAEVYLRMEKADMALECYHKGRHWSKAVELARTIIPDRVIQLEEEWGDHLCENKQFDAAISHYIEAGSTIKALNAAVVARQWKKAIHIADVVEEEEAAGRYYGVIAAHLASVRDYKRAETMYMKGGLYDDIVRMYNEAGMWERAHVVAAEHLDADIVHDMYVRQGEVLERSGRCREAERLYLAVNAPDQAITMYKRVEQYDNMVRLVEQYHPDLLQTTHLHLAQQMESQGKLRAAEIHYLAVDEWKAAMNMYRTLNIWEEAYRVAKQNGGASAANQVAFLWSRTLPIESAIKLLTKFGILESSIDYACETYQYEFAFQLCKNFQTKNKEVHYSYALALEDDGKYPEAETEFILADRTKEAILMYTHCGDWQQAMHVADQHVPDFVPDVLRAHATHAFVQRNFAEFEMLLLRAQQPDAIIHKYKTNGMWSDAIRVCKEYLPQVLPALQDECKRTAANSTNDGTTTTTSATATINKSRGNLTMETLLTRANELVVAGMHKQAIECLLQVDDTIADDSIVRRALLRAFDMTNKFLFDDEASQLFAAIAPRLRQIGEFGGAAQIYANMAQYQEAVDCYIDADDWQNANRVAKEFEPSLEAYIENKYKQKLTKDQNVEQLADVDIMSALDLLVQQRQWTRCLEKAQTTANATIFHRYLALYAAQLLHDGFTSEALLLYHENGPAPASSTQCFPIYNQIAMRMFATKELSKGDGYEMWKTLRQLLFQVVRSLEDTSQSTADVKTKLHFNTLLLITHFFALRSACKQVDLLKGLGAKLSVSMLRYTDIILADKAYYEAGLDMIEDGKLSEAFVFLNHYLDICEAIEDSDQQQLVDHTELAYTDFPSSVPLPEEMFLQENSEEHNRIREWVLTVSMDQKVDQSLPMDDRNLFEVSLEAGQSSCILSGYPILRPDTAVTFSQSTRCANRDAWNKITMAEKLHPDCDVRDVLTFLQHWCGDAAHNGCVKLMFNSH